MPALNRWLGCGRLCKDPRLMYTKQGTPYAVIVLAVNEQYRVRSTGKLQTETLFIDALLWGKQAEVAKQYLQKGDTILVDGKIRLHKWENDYGKRLSRHEIRVRDFQFMPRSVSVVDRAAEEAKTLEAEPGEGDTRPKGE